MDDMVGFTYPMSINSINQICLVTNEVGNTAAMCEHRLCYYQSIFLE